MDDKPRAELRLEPRSLRRHDIARVSNIDQLLHRDGIERKSELHLTAIDTLLQLTKATDTTDKVNALIRAQVLDAEEFVEDEIRRDRHVKHADGVVVIVRTRLRRERIPVVTEVEREVVQCLRLVDLRTLVFDDEVLLELVKELFLGQPIKVLDDTVVVNDSELSSGKQTAMK